MLSDMDGKAIWRKISAISACGINSVKEAHRHCMAIVLVLVWDQQGGQSFCRHLDKRDRRRDLAGKSKEIDTWADSSHR
jgi:hypothetical protein